MAKNIRKMLALVLVMCMFVSALPMQALAAERGERFSKTQVTRGEHKKFEGRSATAKTARAAAPAAAAATSEGFTKTETFTGSNVKIDYTEGESGKQNIAVSGTNSSGAELKDFSGTSESKSDSYEDANTGSTIQKDSTHVEISGTESADGVDKKVDYMEDKTTTTETETNGTVTEQTIVDGLETKKWTENDVGDGEQPDVSADIPLEAGKSDVGTATTVTQTGNATSQEGQTTTTTTDRTVTTQTVKVEVSVNDSNSGLVEDQELVVNGPSPVYDADDNLHINSSNGQPLDKVNGEHVGKEDVFDRNYLSSETLDYINVNGVSVWVNKGTKTIVDIVIPEGTELPDHALLNDITVGSNVSSWYPTSNTFAKKLFPEGTVYQGGVKTNNIDNWYDEDGNLIVTVPEGADFRNVGTGEHSKFYNARVTVVYKKDELGNTIYEDGKPVIEKITKADGTILTIDGVPVTELPDGVSLEPVFDDYNGGRPKTFMLMDKDGNRVYAYCCDMETGAVANAWYSVSNLEDSDYYGSEESEAHIRSIVMNGYWGTSDVRKEDGTYEMGSLEGIKENLRKAINENEMENEVIQMPAVDDHGNPVLDTDGNPVMESKTMLELIDDLTEGEALLATQSAIWAYANGHVDALNGKDGVVVIDPDGYKWNQNPTANSKDGEALDDYGSARVDFLYKWLINLETEEESSIVINEKNFIEELGITIKDKVADKMIAVNSDDNRDNDVYNAELNFKLAFVPGENDNLLVHLTDKNNNPIKDANGNPIVKHLASGSSEGHDENSITPDENGVYTLSGLQLSENTDFEFELRLEGTQYLENGVYVYAPVGGRDVSQTFVGVAEGNRNVDVSVAVTAQFDVEENNHVVVERVWHHEYDPVITPPEEPNTPPEEPNTPPEEPNEPATPAVATAAVWTAPENQRLANEEAVEIPEEPVPLAAPAITGDDTGLWIMAMLLIACGMVAINVFDKKRNRETF